MFKRKVATILFTACLTTFNVRSIFFFTLPGSPLYKSTLKKEEPLNLSVCLEQDIANSSDSEALQRRATQLQREITRMTSLERLNCAKNYATFGAYTGAIIAWWRDESPATALKATLLGAGMGGAWGYLVASRQNVNTLRYNEQVLGLARAMYEKSLRLMEKGFDDLQKQIGGVGVQIDDLQETTTRGFAEACQDRQAKDEQSRVAIQGVAAQIQQNGDGIAANGKLLGENRDMLLQLLNKAKGATGQRGSGLVAGCMVTKATPDVD